MEESPTPKSSDTIISQTNTSIPPQPTLININTPEKKPNIPKTIMSLTKLPTRHFISSPSTSPVSPRRTPGNDSDVESDDEETNSALQTWPAFPSFLDKDIEKCEFETLAYMLTGVPYTGVMVSIVRHAVSAFWENERKLRDLDRKRIQYESSRVQIILKKRQKLIASLVKDGLKMNLDDLKNLTKS